MSRCPYCDSPDYEFVMDMNVQEPVMNGFRMLISAECLDCSKGFLVWEYYFCDESMRKCLTEEEYQEEGEE